jgi:predicted enzyme related to lactoylglutathione lyase
MDSVVHFEIPVDDDSRAQSFYADVFGWDIRRFPEMDYTMASTGAMTEDGMPTEPGRINGGFYHRTEGLPTGPVVTIGVDDIDAALARVRDHGGRIVRERFEVENMGIGAYVADTEDNVIGLWQDTMDASQSQT